MKDPYSDRVRRPKVVCQGCSSLWVERSGTNHEGLKTLLEDIKDCPDCVGTFRNPIPIAEVMMNERTE